MIDFLKVEQNVKTLKQQLVNQQIDQATFEAKLLDMIELGDDGYYWMFGHNTEQWYRHNGHTWQVADPRNPNAIPPAKNIKAIEASPLPPPPQPLTWGDVDLNWFFVGLVLLGVVSGILFASGV